MLFIDETLAALLWVFLLVYRALFCASLNIPVSLSSLAGLLGYTHLLQKGLETYPHALRIRRLRTNIRLEAKCISQVVSRCWSDRHDHIPCSRFLPRACVGAVVGCASLTIPAPPRM